MFNFGKKEKKHSDYDSDDTQFHSRMYDRYFEGYDVFYEVNEKGKRKLKRVYKGEYYRADLSDSGQTTLRILYAALFVFSLVMYISTAMRGNGINLVFYTAIPQALLIPFYVWMAYSLISYMITRRDMTIGEYKSCSNGVKRTAFILFIVYCLWALCCIIFMFSYPEYGFQGGYLARVILGGTSCFIISVIENRIPYLTIENADAGPDARRD